MNEINCPHDRVFKSAMADLRVARNFLEHYLPPDVHPFINLDSLSLCPNSYVDQTLKLSLSDILFKVNISNQTGYIYVLCEHQSSVNALMPFRLWQYIVAIWSDHLKQKPKKQNTKLPLVIPIVFYHGERPYDGPQNIRDLIEAPAPLIDSILFKPFHLIDTHHLEDETLREQQWVGVMSFVMKNIFQRELLSFAPLFIEMLQALTAKEADTTDFAVLLLNYILKTGSTEEPEAFVDLVKEGFSNPTGEKIMTVADWLKAQGKEAGIRAGESTMLVHLLECKFGVIPTNYWNRIQEADSEQLLFWSERMLKANSLKSVFDAS